MQSKKNCFVLSIACFAILSLHAQTNVIKVNALKSNNYGIQYFLPKTVLEIEAEYGKTERKAGPYAKYASKYLGIDEAQVILENQTDYTLNKLSVKALGVPNKKESYLVELKSKTVAPFVYLTENGLICSINAEYVQPPTAEKVASAPAAAPLKIQPQSVYTEEYLRAGSVSKMAEIAAKNIYRIRESRSDLLTGEAENAPKDGEAMKIVLANLEAQEKVWTELFTGTTATETKTETFQIEPLSEVHQEILFRFARYAGIVDNDDLSGAPVYINLTDLHAVDLEEADPKRKEKDVNSIVYNVPGSVAVEIIYDGRSLFKGEFPATQLGKTQRLAPALLEDKKAPAQIYFYPFTGAIKQII
jgi:hypothetical protein